MLKHLLASSAILTLSLSPAIALSGPQTNAQNMTPVPNPDGYSASQINRLAAPAMGPGATLGGQLIIAHVANNAALSLTLPNLGRVRRDGFTASNDGGAADYYWVSATCATADGGTCVNGTSGGSWKIDWASVHNEVSPCLFESCSTSTDDTAAINLAALQGYSVDLRGRSTWNVSSDLTFYNEENVHGQSGFRTSIVPNFATGHFTNGVITSNGEPGPIFRDFRVIYAQPTAAGSVPTVLPVPFFYLQNTPRFKIIGVDCWGATVCLDMRGSGGAYIEDFKLSALGAGILLDNELDTVRIVNPHWYPFGLGSVMTNTYFYGQGAATTSAKSGMVGNGTITMAPAPATYPAIVGTYKAIYSTSSSSWNLTDPNGVALFGSPANGQAYNNQIAFTIAAGSTAPANGDEFDIAVTQVRPVGIMSGRMDDLQVTGGLFIGGLGMKFFYGTYAGNSAGPTFASLVNVDFDSKSGVEVGPAANIFLNGCQFTTDVVPNHALTVWGGANFALATNVSLNGGSVGSATSFTGGNYPQAEVVADAAPVGQPNGGAAGFLGITNFGFGSNVLGADFTSIYQGNFSLVQISNTHTVRLPNPTTPYTKPVFDLEGGRTMAELNFMDDQNTTTSVLFKVGNDNGFNKVINNMAPGATVVGGTTAAGTYTGNSQ